MNGVIRNGLVCLCGAALLGVLWLGAHGQPVADGFRTAGLLLGTVAIVVIAGGLIRD